MPELDYIAPANPWQVGELEELRRRSIEHWPAHRAALAANPDVVAVDPAAIAAGQVRVAYDHNGDTVGFSCTVPRSAEVYALEALFVDPLEFGLGIGRGLLGDAFAWVRRHGGSAIEVVSAAETVGFYEKAGFTPVGDAVTAFGPAQVMRAAC